MSSSVVILYWIGQACGKNGSDKQNRLPVKPAIVP
jgi:hypothetical protein